MSTDRPTYSIYSTLLHFTSARKRVMPQLSFETAEARSRLYKTWSRHKYCQHMAETSSTLNALSSRAQALQEFRDCSEILYQHAIQFTYWGKGWGQMWSMCVVGSTCGVFSILGEGMGASCRVCGEWRCGVCVEYVCSLNQMSILCNWPDHLLTSVHLHGILYHSWFHLLFIIQLYFFK